MENLGLKLYGAVYAVWTTSLPRGSSSILLPLLQIP
jgi:hypothetical protein